MYVPNPAFRIRISQSVSLCGVSIDNLSFSAQSGVSMNDVVIVPFQSRDSIDDFVFTLSLSCFWIDDVILSYVWEGNGVALRRIIISESL